MPVLHNCGSRLNVWVTLFGRCCLRRLGLIGRSHSGVSNCAFAPFSSLVSWLLRASWSPHRLRQLPPLFTVVAVAVTVTVLPASGTALEQHRGQGDPATRGLGAGKQAIIHTGKSQVPTRTTSTETVMTHILDLRSGPGRQTGGSPG
jgi:hypothetical protein